ncbi:Protein msta_ isoform Alike, partial [Caligus rogercresseyi]
INDGDGGSDLICPNCKKTAVCQGKDLSYICESCKTPFPEGRDTLIQHYEALEDILEDPMRCSVEDFEAFILERKDVLHPRNLIFIRLMYSLIGFYGRLSGYEMHQMTAKMLKRKWEAGEEVRKALEAFDHGISTYKGKCNE